jgi:hypothetical protein
LSKPEATLENIKKAYPNLTPTDSALLAVALTVCGRQALAEFEGNKYRWPDDLDKFASALGNHFVALKSHFEVSEKKRAAKAMAEEEPITVTYTLHHNSDAGDEFLKGHNDLISLLHEILDGNVEYQFTPSDLMWQNAIDRINFDTRTGAPLGRRFLTKAEFAEGINAVEAGTSSKRKRAPRTKAAKEEVPAESG